MWQHTIIKYLLFQLQIIVGHRFWQAGSAAPWTESVFALLWVIHGWKNSDMTVNSQMPHDKVCRNHPPSFYTLVLQVLWHHYIYNNTQPCQQLVENKNRLTFWDIPSTSVPRTRILPYIKAHKYNYNTNNPFGFVQIPVMENCLGCTLHVIWM